MDYKKELVSLLTDVERAKFGTKNRSELILRISKIIDHMERVEKLQEKW